VIVTLAVAVNPFYVISRQLLCSLTIKESHQKHKWWNFVLILVCSLNVTSKYAFGAKSTQSLGYI